MDTIDTKLLIKYDLYKHDIGVRVVSSRDGRRGTVIQIRETAPEWIEPLVKWDNDETSFISDSYLFLEEA